MKTHTANKKIILLILPILIIIAVIFYFQTKAFVKNPLEGKKIEVYLPKLLSSYSAVGVHWNELTLENVTLMDQPLLESSDIVSMDNQTIQIKKNFILVNGSGMETGALYENEGILSFQYHGKEYNVDSSSPELFYNYRIYDIGVVKEGDNIFLVQQRDFGKEKDSTGNLAVEREYKKDIIGIPYVLVVDGKKTEIGVIKVDDAEFAVPKAYDSWCYMGLPDGLACRIPEGAALKIEE